MIDQWLGPGIEVNPPSRRCFGGLRPRKAGGVPGSLKDRANSSRRRRFNSEAEARNFVIKKRSYSLPAALLSGR